MASGIPSTIQVTPFSQEALITKTKLGQPAVLGGVIYNQFQQYNLTTGAATIFQPIVSGVASTAVSFVNKQGSTATLSPSFQGDVILPATALQNNVSLGQVLAPSNLLSNGALYRVRAIGFMTSAAVTTISCGLGILKPGTTTNITGWTPPTTFATAPGVTTAVPIEVEWIIHIQNYSATYGTISAYGYFRWIATATGIATTYYTPSSTVTGSLDTTQSIQIDPEITTAAAVTATSLNLTSMFIEQLS